MCGLVVTVSDDGPEPVIQEIRGDPDHPLSRGYTCPKGRALGALHHHPERLDDPSQRHGASMAPTGWDDCLDDLASRIGTTVADHGPDAVGMYLASGSAFDAAGRRTAERWLRQLGSAQKYTATTIDTPSKPLVAELVSGWSGLTPLWDERGSKLLLLLGTNPVVSHGHSNCMPDPVTRLRDAGRRGEVWVVDPRATETAKLATRHLAARAGSDWCVLGWLVRSLLDGGADEGFLAAHVEGVERLRAAVGAFDDAMATAHTGLAVEDLRALLDAVRQAGRVSALTGTGVSMSASANVTEWLLWALEAVTGSLDRPGGVWFNPGFMMQIDTRTLTPTDGVAERGPASRPELPRRFGEYPCAGLVDEIEAGNLRALLVVGGNPLTALPDRERTEAALRNLDVLAVADIVRTDTTALATHLLPCAGQLERADLPWLLDCYQLEVASQYSAAVVPPARRRWPLWRIMAELGSRLGLDVLPGGMDAATATDDDLLAPIAARGRADLATLQAHPSGISHGGPVHGWVSERLLADGRWRIAPAEMVAQLQDLLRAPVPTGPVLIPRRQLRTMNSQMRALGGPVGYPPQIRALIHPADAAVAGVGDGDEVTITARTGSVVARVQLDAGLVPGAVSLPHGWDHPNVCALTSASADVDPLTGMVLQSGLPVQLSATTLR